MTRKIRIFLSLFILAFSLALLVWSLWPLDYETRIQQIEPQEMQLSTPSSFLPGSWLAS